MKRKLFDNISYTLTLKRKLFDNIGYLFAKKMKTEYLLYQEVTSDSLLEHFGRNRKLNNQGKRSSHCDAQSLAIIVADVLEIHQYFQFTTNESFRKC
jgi:hypothetical protein